jgi:hypothetical protein
MTQNLALRRFFSNHSDYADFHGLTERSNQDGRTECR